jgi:hypothetical protein
MNWKKLAVAAAAGTALLGASSAFANPPRWAPAYGWHAKHHHPHYVYAYPAPAYVYVPPPVVYYPPPPPRPVIYGRIPLDHGTRIGFRIGL